MRTEQNGEKRTPAPAEQPDGQHRAKAIAARAVGRRAMSRRELEKKLQDRGVEEADRQVACQWLEELGAVNDGEYAAQLARHYSRRGYGPGHIRQVFREKGIDRGLWEEALSGLEPEEERAALFLRRKLGGRTPEEPERRRLNEALLRRGFVWRHIRGAWDLLGLREDGVFGDGTEAEEEEF